MPSLPWLRRWALQFGGGGGGGGHTARVMWGECESACCHGNKAAPQPLQSPLRRMGGNVAAVV